MAIAQEKPIERHKRQVDHWSHEVAGRRATVRAARFQRLARGLETYRQRAILFALQSLLWWRLSAARWGTAVIAIILCAAALFVALVAVGAIRWLGAAIYVPLLLVIALGCGGVLGAALIYPGAKLLEAIQLVCVHRERAQNALNEAQVNFENALAAYLEASRTLTAHREQYKAALAEIERIRRLNDINWRREQLLRKAWMSFRGDDFEEFLFEVLSLNGYQVQRTGKTGDHGVDLIAVRNGVRIAIQAKGYPNSTVGNDAVQQVHLGREIWGCHRSAVITNSTFTRHAMEAALVARCSLIDHVSLRELAYDRVRLDLST